MALRTMVGNWTGPHPSSVNQPPTSTGMRPAGAHRAPASSTAALRPSSPPPPPASGKRPAPPVVDIQICLALSGRPASLEGLSPEPGDASELASAATVAAPGLDGGSWSGNGSVVPLARPRRALVPKGPAPAPPPGAATPARAARPVAAAPARAALPTPPSPPRRSTPAPPPQRRRAARLGALAALLALLIAGALQLPLRTPIEAPGAVFAPAKVAAVAAAQAGTLVRLLVQPGDSVVEDQVVAQLATAPFEAELRLRWEAFLELQSALAAAESDAATLRDQSAAAVASAAWGVVQAQSALAAASVRAPCRGRVETIDARPGSRVAPGQALLHVAPAGVARSIIAFLPAEEQPFVQPGSPAAVLLSAPEPQAPRSSDARVTHVAAGALTADELHQALPGAGPGAFVRVQLELQGAAPELLDQLHTGGRVSVRLQGRERRAVSVMLEAMRTLLG